MHKWLERLTHTNIHISWAEKIPQGFDRAICVRQTGHKENTHAHEHTCAHTEGMTALRLSVTWLQSHGHGITADKGSPSHWSFYYC